MIAHSDFTRASNSQATRARKIAVCDQSFSGSILFNSRSFAANFSEMIKMDF